MAFWNVIFFREHRYVPDPHREAQWNRGAYLATALGHCGECHPPRNVGFAMSTRNYLSGATIEGWKAYNATSDAEYGIGNWTDAQLTGYLSRGLVAGRRAASGPMAEVVQDSLQYVTPSDIGALLVYLRTIAPQKGVASSGINLQPPAFNASNAVLPGTIDASNSRGRQIFDGNCAGCHRRDGKGRESAYASLKGSHAVNDTAGSAPIQVLLRGTQLKVGAATHTMPGFGAIYSDADIAAVANYVVAHFGNKQATVSAPDVQRARQAQ
jgi:mono/diheme cytochrome c family protein